MPSEPEQNDRFMSIATELVSVSVTASLSQVEAARRMGVST
jgi:hypothetical protein